MISSEALSIATSDCRLLPITPSSFSLSLLPPQGLLYTRRHFIQGNSVAQAALLALLAEAASYFHSDVITLKDSLRRAHQIRAGK
jgi:hypothetical protein